MDERYRFGERLIFGLRASEMCVESIKANGDFIIISCDPQWRSRGRAGRGYLRANRRRSTALLIAVSIHHASQVRVCSFKERQKSTRELIDFSTHCLRGMR